jgi:hypothetical protein
MPRSRTRARKRRALLENVRAEFEEKRRDPEALAALVRRLAESDLCVWAIARPAASNMPLDEAERAMIAQVVAPRLAGMTPGSVHRRRKLSRLTLPTTSPEIQELSGTSQVSGLTPEN